MPGEVARWTRRAGSLALDGHSARMEDYVPNARRHFEVSVHAPGPDQLAVLFSDITDRRKARMELQRLVRERTADLARFNQTLKATLACNQAIIRTSSETGLLEECCRLCLAVQGVDRAWVGLAGAEAGRPVRLAAAIGCPGEGWSPERAAWAGADAGPGPTGIAIRTGRVCLRRRGRGDPGGARATLALPLLADQAAFGALVLEAAEATFDPGQVLLLKEVANNLAIGITALRSRSERDQALQTAKRQTEQLRALALELSRTKQRERERLAGVLHDHLQQVLVGATFGIETLAGQVRSRAALDTLDRLAETVQRAMGISRDLTVELSPPVFREKGLAAGLRWLGHQARRDYGLKVELDLEGHLEPGAEAIRLFIFEAVRELLLNVAKHARVDRTRVQARPLGAGAIEIRVEDAGAGFDPASLDGLAFPGAGLGLLGIRERLRALRGALEIVSAPGRGSRFTVVVPVQAAEPAQAGSGG